ncbi:ROK family protein [Paenibacillus whitsoniae]|nr:ROK family protein [Paenibacillus whitsoniae]
MYRLEPDAPYAVGVDVGGTKINAGIVDERGEVLHTVSVPTLAGSARTEDRIVLAIREVLGGASGSLPPLALRGIGVGTAGQIDWAEGAVRSASDLLPGYAGTPLRRLLEAQFPLPVRVDNDVNVLALTEKRLGAARGVNDFICLALGTGVGGALVTGGRLVHGAWGGAGELGHLAVDLHGPPCLCGGRGCLEQYASGTSIARRMRERLAAEGQADALIDAREVFARWHAGEPLAAALMQESMAALGAAIASLIHMWNPQVVVIGGGVAEAGEHFFAELRAEAERRTMPAMWAGVRIEPAYRGNWGGMIGAALQLWE